MVVIHTGKVTSIRLFSTLDEAIRIIKAESEGYAYKNYDYYRCYDLPVDDLSGSIQMINLTYKLRKALINDSY